MTEGAEALSRSGGRVVLVTGGSRGIGQACVNAFLKRGDRVAFSHRHGPGDGHDPAALAITCDITSSEQVNTMFDEVEASLGPVEVLVANAGTTDDHLLVRMDDASWNEVISTNLGGTFLTVRRAMRSMLKARRGRVVMISSVTAFRGQAGQANYAASKAGMLGLARSLAREVATRNITVNVVAPGAVDTDMLAQVTPEMFQHVLGQVPMSRVATVEEVAAAVDFLASPEASYITGTVLPVDGGLSMGM